jgi:hypothetical protein
MKKLFIALFITALGSTAFAAEGNPQNEKVMQTFSSEYGNAKNVTWREIKEEGIFHATFELNDEKLDVFIDAEGEVLAASRYITAKQLPMAVTKQLAVKYAGYTVSPSIIEYSARGETGYCITLSGEKNSVVVKADSAGGLSVFKKQKNYL